MDDSQLEFRWTLKDPFVPRIRREAILYRTKWEATIESETARVIPHEGGACPFTFKLRYICARHPFVLQHLLIKITVLNEVEWTVHDGGYTFNAQNRYSFTSTKFTRSWECDLDIQVRMTMNHDYEYHALPLMLYPPARSFEGQMITSGFEQLSEDLGRLLNEDNPYTDLSLRLADGSLRKVHSFMIRARWSNFFTHHRANEIVDIAISKNLLSDLLIYLYTGCGPLVDGTNSTDLLYMTEAMEVMHIYDIRHLSRIFETIYYSYEQHFQSSVSTTKAMIKLPPESAPYLLNRSPVEGIYISFCIVLYLDREPPSFDYKLKFWCEKTCYVRVNLDFVVKYPQNRVAFWPVFERDYEPVRRDSEERETGSFNGDFPEFQDYLRRPEVQSLKRYFRITLYVSDGKEVQTFTRIANEYYRVLQDEDSRMDLSRNMYECQRQITPEQTDLSVQGNDDEIHSVHKAIFTTRIDEWRRVLLSVSQADSIPSLVSCKFSKEALEHIIEFIYSGAMYGCVPESLFPEMKSFAELGGVPSLKRYLSIAAGANDSERRHPLAYNPILRILYPRQSAS